MKNESWISENHTYSTKRTKTSIESPKVKTLSLMAPIPLIQQAQQFTRTMNYEVKDGEILLKKISYCQNHLYNCF